jgi:hypothetical protein
MHQDIEYNMSSSCSKYISVTLKLTLSDDNGGRTLEKIAYNGNQNSSILMSSYLTNMVARSETTV